MMRQFRNEILVLVMDNGTVTKAFAAPNGVKQGCTISPTPFNLAFSVMLIDAYRDRPLRTRTPIGPTTISSSEDWRSDLWGQLKRRCQGHEGSSKVSGAPDPQCHDAISHSKPALSTKIQGRIGLVGHSLTQFIDSPTTPVAAYVTVPVITLTAFMTVSTITPNAQNPGPRSRRSPPLLTSLPQPS
ncbi:hypothetical protein SprV_0100291500 [Sparganum proliferum]